MKNDTNSRPKWRNQSPSVKSAPKRVLTVKMNNFFEDKPSDQDTGTWPLKGSKRRRPRPLTATLAKPRLLDITLLGKIDMSLMRKELLSVYRLMRMPIERVNVSDKKLKKKKDENDKKLVKNDIMIEITDAKETENAIIALRKEKSPFKLFPCSNGVKRNKGKVDVAFSGPLTGKTLTKPCDSCGRASRPERLHAHPQKMSLSPVRVKSSPRLGEEYEKLSLSSMKSPTERLEPVTAATMTLTPIHQKHHKKADSSAKRSPDKVDEAPPLCPYCGRRFGTTSLPIHEAKCRERRDEKLNTKTNHEESNRSNTPRELDDDLSKKLSLRNITIKDRTTVSNNVLRSPRKFELQVEKEELSVDNRSPNHRSILSPNKEKGPNRTIQTSPRRRSDDDPAFKAIDVNLEWETHLQSLVKCNVCGRGFAPERILRHQSICIGSSKRIGKSRTRSNIT